VSRPLLSAALIVRDEETSLPRCLASLQGSVDETVIVDTGSTDRSRAIALAHGARVVERKWTDDFSAARNASVDAASGEWIFYIDADEELVAFDRGKVEALLRDSANLACTVLLRPISGYTRYREHRLFRNRPDLRFRGVMHESIVPALGEVGAREARRVVDSTVAIDHHGYELDSLRKHQRNLPLLHARIEADPGHVYSWWHLGQTLRALGDSASAEKAWRQAIEIIRLQPASPLGDSLSYLDLARDLVERGKDATALIEEGCERFPENCALAWLRARSLVDAGRHEEALPLFARLAVIDPESFCGGPIGYDKSIFGANAYAAMGLCAFRLERFGESAEYYAKAETLAPGDQATKRKRQLAEIKAGGSRLR
jgi:glycosyltransferase involved in cell wall biosynthesis